MHFAWGSQQYWCPNLLHGQLHIFLLNLFSNPICKQMYIILHLLMTYKLLDCNLVDMVKWVAFSTIMWLFGRHINMTTIATLREPIQSPTTYLMLVFQLLIFTISLLNFLLNTTLMYSSPYVLERLELFVCFYCHFIQFRKMWNFM